MRTLTPAIINQARRSVGLTTAEAAQLVHSSQRAWEHWEAGTRSMSMASFELFLRKVSAPYHHSFREHTSLVVVVGPKDTVVDVVARGNFMSLTDIGNDQYTISSMAVVDGELPRPYTTTFSKEGNDHVLDAARKWKREAEGQHQE